jgi:hypothetical protein
VKRPTRTKRSILVRPKNELRRLNRSEKVKRGLSLKGAYYVPKGTKVTKSTAYVTVSSWRDFQLGVPHGKAAKMRKAKELGYGPRGLSEFAPQSVRTRIRLAKPQYEQPWQHAYINTAGDVSYDFFWKQGLRHMQDYQHALDVAIALDDGIGLLRFKYIKIVTYDGPGVPHYRNKGVRVRPEYRLHKIKEKLASMTDREKARFEADRRYRERDVVHRGKISHRVHSRWPTENQGHQFLWRRKLQN